MKKHLSAPPIPADDAIWAGGIVRNNTHYIVPKCEATPIMMECNILSGEIIPGSNDPEPFGEENDNENWS